MDGSTSKRFQENVNSIRVRCVMYINEIFDKLGNLGNTEEIVISFQYHLDGIIK